MNDNVLGVTVGHTVEFSKTISADDIAAFAKASGDEQPLHTNPAYAAKSRFKRPVAHGILTAGLISAALGTRLAPHATAVYLSQTLRFLRPVFPGDTITATLEVISLDPEKRFVTCKTDCVNQEGQPVLTGEATVLLDTVE